MKKLIFVIIFGFNLSFAAELPPLPPLNADLGPFTGLETTVGYIQKENGEKFLVVETPEGTKLVKVKSNPSEILGKPKIK
ncbi:MAG: hypothetical protein N2Z81_02645 [Hydrogenothermaceae bacterium]|nr:hypothetical protein [Hydrogenothermaceae bacterium]